MKKTCICGFLLFFLAIVCGARTGFAYSTWSDNGTGNCKGCHPEGTPGSATAPQLHGITAHTSNCANCHTGSPAAGNVSPAACIACHPSASPGLCPLINQGTAGASHGATCLACHTTCAAATTTTTTAATDNATCFTIAPNSVQVDGASDVTLDVTVTFTRADVINLTPEDRAKLSVVIDTSCAQYITVNSYSIDNSSSVVTATANITVQGSAPAAQCKIKVTDPQNVATPPLNCESTFTITQTGEGVCSVVSVEPLVSFLPLSSGLFPRPRNIIITGENSNWNRTTAVSIQDVKVVIPLVILPTRILALIVTPSTLTGFTAGDKAITVVTGSDVCSGTATFQ